jgi:hypothetical protein
MLEEPAAGYTYSANIVAACNRKHNDSSSMSHTMQMQTDGLHGAGINMPEHVGHVLPLLHTLLISAMQKQVKLCRSSLQNHKRQCSCALQEHAVGALPTTLFLHCSTAVYCRRACLTVITAGCCC